MTETKMNPQNRCPECGSIMECHTHISLNIIDLIGGGTVLVFVFWILALIAYNPPWQFIIIVATIVITIVILVIKGWHKKLAEDPIMHIGLFAIPWAIAGAMLAIYTFIKYFLGIGFDKKCVCKHCNHLHGGKK